MSIFFQGQTNETLWTSRGPVGKGWVLFFPCGECGSLKPCLKDGTLRSAATRVHRPAAPCLAAWQCCAHVTPREAPVTAVDRHVSL